eukprot:UN11225
MYESVLKDEFKQYAENNDFLTFDTLLPFMNAGYPETNPDKVENGVKVVLREFGKGSRIRWKDMLKMYTVSWSSNPKAVKEELIHRGFKSLNEVGDLIDHLVSFKLIQTYCGWIKLILN